MANDYVAHSPRKISGMQKLGLAMAAFGQGMTGQPYASNIMNSWQKQDDLAAEQSMREWQMKQAIQENQIKLAQAGLMPDVNGDITIGDSKYSRRPPLMPDLSQLSKLGGGSGLGVTGLTLDPITGETKVNIGQTPESKQQIENEQRVSKAVQEEETKYRSGRAVIEQIKNAWLRTSPPKVLDDKGKLGLSGMAKGILQPAYGVEQWLGSRMQITPNQRADNQYVRLVNSLRSRLAKGAIGSDVGNLSEYEQRVVTEGVPSMTWDTYENGMGIIDNLYGVIDAMKQARLDGYKSLDEKLKKDGKVLSKEKATEYLQQANGDKERARTLALRDGWYF